MTKRAAFSTGASFLVLSGAIWIYTSGFPSLDAGYPGPALFPQLVATGLAACGIGLLLSGRRSDTAVSSSEAGHFLRLVAGIGAVILYPPLHAAVGFLPAMAALMVGIGLLLRADWRWLGVLAVGGTALFYVVFTQGLGVPL